MNLLKYDNCETLSARDFPQQLHGIIFTEIVPEFLREVSPNKLIELGVIVRMKQRERIYEPLTNSLRKIQWVRLVGLKAVSIEEEIAREMEPTVAASDPLGQTVYALCITDVLIHTKSALDSMAVFLNDLLDLGAKGGDRDFKKPEFRRLVADKDQFLKHEMKKHESWFRQLQEMRDEWIHRSSIRCRLVVGRSPVGVLPIPKQVHLSFEEQKKLPITRDDFYSTKDFVEHHYSNLLSLFIAVVDRATQIERLDLKEPPKIPAEIEKELATFPFTPAENMQIHRFKMKKHESVVDW